MTRTLYDQRGAMRDGVELSADVFLPDGPGPWPTVLLRTPYDNSQPQHVDDGIYYASHGYAYVVQDVRGRGDSDGKFIPRVAEAYDGHDTIVWLGTQSWCDGKVGMCGGSYTGMVQWLAARERPPHLAALVSTAASGRWMEETPYLFGTFMPDRIWWLNLLGGRSLQQPTYPPRPALPDFHTLLTHRPLRDADLALGRTNTVWREYLEHDTYDDYWKQFSLDGYFARIDLPVLHITGWFDADQRGQLYYYSGMMSESPAPDRQWLLCGPWTHAGTRRPVQRLGDRDFGADSVMDVRGVHVRFFDRFLKGRDESWTDEPRVRLFAMGINAWKGYRTWPPPGTRTTNFYLSSDGSANTELGHGVLGSSRPDRDGVDEYRYNPDDPTPSMRDASEVLDPHQGLDNRWRLARSDTLVYTSEPLQDDVTVAGVPYLVLFASTDGPDTDWHAQLCEVGPDGASEEVSTASLRATYRAGRYVPPSPIEPNRVVEYRLEFSAVMNVWRRGQRLRLVIASARYPALARNPNTNARTGDDDVVRIARNRVFHGPGAPSRVELPTLSESDRERGARLA